MEENNDQAPSPKTALLEQLPGYISVKEAARALGISERSVYGYLESKRLAGGRIGKFIVVHAEGLSHFETKPPGRVRTITPRWRRPPRKNRLYLTTITVRVRAGQGDAFRGKLTDICLSKRHAFAGTAARYISQNQHIANEVEIILVWRSAVIPSEEVREAAFDALRLEFAEVCEWETATHKEGLVLLHA